MEYTPLASDYRYVVTHDNPFYPGVRYFNKLSDAVEYKTQLIEHLGNGSEYLSNIVIAEIIDSCAVYSNF